MTGSVTTAVPAAISRVNALKGDQVERARSVEAVTATGVVKAVISHVNALT